MSAATLREAASILRWRAEDATPGPWRNDGNAIRSGRDAIALTYRTMSDAADSDQRFKDSHYMATVHPDVSLYFADLLDALAKRVEDISDTTPTVAFGERVAEESLTGYRDALAVARLLIEEKS